MYRLAPFYSMRAKASIVGCAFIAANQLDRTSAVEENVMSTVANCLSPIALTGSARLSLLHLLSRRRPGSAQSGDGVYCCAEPF